MTAYVNAMTYISGLHESGSHPNDGQHKYSANPTVPSSNDRMTENTIVCRMYKRLTVLHKSQMHWQTYKISGASLSEPHTYDEYAATVCMCIDIYICI